MLVQHHTKYKEIHGVDEVVMMEYAEHIELHKRLRAEGKCVVPPDQLHKIAHAAHRRTPKGRATQLRNRKRGRQYIEFYEAVDTNISLVERIVLNRNTGSVYYMSRFKGERGRKVLFFDIPTYWDR